jgi:hypothetical protein
MQCREPAPAFNFEANTRGEDQLAYSSYPVGRTVPRAVTDAIRPLPAWVVPLPKTGSE